jgi:hypothetical protein
MSKIFIGYSRKDRRFVDALAADLRRKGFQAYYDKQLKPGEDYEKILAEKLDGARYVLVVLSPDSLKSRNVQNELARGLERERDGRATVIPILARPCGPEDLRMFLGPKQYADFTNGYQFGLDELVSVLGGSEAVTDGDDEHDGGGVMGKTMLSKHKTEIILGLLSAVVALTVAYWQFVYKADDKEPEKKSYQGRVMEKGSEANIKRAKVSLEAQGIPPTDYTDDNGIYSLSLSGKPDAVKIKVEATGYQPFNEHVGVTEDGFKTIYLTPVAPTPSPTPLINTVVPSASPSASPRRTPTAKPSPSEATNSDPLEERRKAINAANNDNRP